MKTKLFVAMALATMITVPAYASLFPVILFEQGFEDNISGWDVFNAAFHPTRVETGTNGITSSAGSWHAEVDTHAATDWGGYSLSFPSGGYQTSLDIFLNVDGGWENDTRFDFTSAIGTPGGVHRRDFVFNVGFYEDNDNQGDRFIVSAGNNAGRANSYPTNPGQNPFAINQTGWYTFQHTFYDSGDGVLAVDLAILDDSSSLLNQWTLSNPLDIIGSTVGGNSYGWVANNEFEVLAIDNSTLGVVPEPATMTLLGLGLAGFAVKRFRRKRS